MIMIMIISNATITNIAEITMIISTAVIVFDVLAFSVIDEVFYLTFVIIITDTIPLTLTLLLIAFTVLMSSLWLSTFVFLFVLWCCCHGCSCRCYNYHIHYHYHYCFHNCYDHYRFIIILFIVCFETI